MLFYINVTFMYILYFVLVVLQHHPTMLRLLSALAGCSGSTLAMLLGSAAPAEQLALGEFGEPLSVGDAVFQLLAMLARKATSPQLILRPLFDFLSSGKYLQILYNR